MDGREATTKLELCHKNWLSSILSIPYHSIGIDLSDNQIGIELKNRYDKYSRNHYAVHNYQIDSFPRENKGRELFWAFLLYGLNTKLSKINGTKNLEKFVSYREIWFFQWDWIKQFPISSPKTGPYRYVNKSSFPSNSSFHRFKRGNGNLYVPPNSILEKRLI